nr:Fic family protein [Coxiella burnetii]
MTGFFREINVKNKGRYSTKGTDEGEFEPGSNGLVLRNLQKIKALVELETYETKSLSVVSDALIDKYDADHCFSGKDICDMHKAWLGDLYGWAGKYRQVNMSKAGFTFAAAHLIPKLMNQFEEKELRQYTPCAFKSHDEILSALAVVHTELVLIHPFREGNGRLSRLLSTLMALQAGLPILNFSGIKNEWQEQYFAAVRAGLDHNYDPMKTIFLKVLSQSQ